MKSKKKINILLILLIITLILFVGIYYYIYRTKSPYSNVDSPKNNIELNQKEIPTTEIIEIPVRAENFEVISDIVYASVKMDKEGVNDTFKIIVGSLKGNIQSGDCEYDENTRTYTGNNTFYLEDTSTFLERLKQDDEMLLRFIFPINTDTGIENDGIKNQKNNVNQVLLTNTVSDLNQVLVPQMLCIAY